MSTQLTLAEQEALTYLYGGGDETIECWSASWIMTRYPQKCVSIMHAGSMTIPAKTRMIVERAKVEGQFGSCYTCEACIGKAEKELGEKS